jgi:2-oxoglutarate ferredoxin oxidoreductase subunit alpha
MMDARLGKLAAMRREMNGITCYPAEEVEAEVKVEKDLNLNLASTTLICFGSTYGPVSEAVDVLCAKGANVGMVHLSELSPLPRDLLLTALEHTPKLVTVENNATAQLAHLIQAELQVPVRESVLKYDGRPFSVEEVVGEVERKL